MSKIDTRIILTSNASTDYFPDNCLSSFCNVLPDELSSLHISECKILLDYLSFQTNFHNVPAFVNKCINQFQIYVKDTWNIMPRGTKSDKATTLHKRLTSNHYSPESFVTSLNAMFHNHSDNINFEYKENGENGTLQINGVGCALIINTRIAQWMGFTVDVLNTYEVKSFSGESGESFTRVDFSDHDVTSIPINISFSFLQPILPKVIKVVLNELIPSMHIPSRPSKILSIIPFTSNRQEGFYYESNQKEWMPINMLHVSSLSVKLLDENDEKLNLGLGQPTFLRLRITNAMESDYFTMRISSRDNVDADTNSDFRFDLDEPLQLIGNWHVALSSIHYPAEFECFEDLEEETPQIAILNPNGRGGMSTFRSFNQRDFNSTVSLLSALQRALKYFCEISITENNQLEFRFVGYTTIILVFSHSLSVLLGLTNIANTLHMKRRITHSGEQLLSFIDTSKYSLEADSIYPAIRSDKSQTIRAPGAVNLDILKPSIMMLYCNVIKPVMIGAKQLKLLKLISVKKKAYYECKRLDFIPLSSNYISSIHFQLNRSDGHTIKFKKNYAPVLYTLVFRKM